MDKSKLIEVNNKIKELAGLDDDVLPIPNSNKEDKDNVKDSDVKSVNIDIMDLF